MPLKEVDSLLKVNKYREVFIVTIAIFFLFILSILSQKGYLSNPVTGYASLNNYSNGGCSDLDNDGKVSIRDLREIQKQLKKTNKDPDFNSQLDYDKNGIIDNVDISCLQSDFGKSIKCPKDTKKCGCIQGCFDLNNDGQVNVIDLSILSKKSGLCVNDKGYDPKADFDGNGCINSHQLSQDYICLQTNLGKKDITCGYDNTNGGCSDLDNDNLVSEKDYNKMLKLRGSKVNDQSYDPKADYNYDGRVDDIDIACFNEDEGNNIKCPKDSRYCGCFNGCPDLNGDGIVSINDINYFNTITGTCKNDLNYNEKADFDKDNCIETNKGALDFLCINYNLGQNSFCNIIPSQEPLNIKDVKKVGIKVSAKTNTKITFKSINNEILGYINLENGIYYDGIKLINSKPMYIEITGNNPNIKDGIIKIYSEDNSNINLYIPFIKNTPFNLFLNKEGHSYYDAKLNNKAADINSRYINTEKEISYSPQKCNELKCIVISLIKDYYLHLIVIFIIIIATHYFNKKIHL